MSIQQSYLAQPQYGYDTVVAVSQRALNDIIKSYYYNNRSKFSEITKYFIIDQRLPTIGSPLETDRANFTVDPFTVPSWNGSGSMPADVATLAKATCLFAFKFAPGDPSGLGMGAVNYLTLNPATNTVLYYLLCSQIQVVFMDFDKNTWTNVTQTKSGEFNIHATINLHNVINNTNLPPAVQAQVNNLGGSGLTVQQLLFDLDSAVVDPTSSFSGLDSSTYNRFDDMMQAFATAYFDAYKAVEPPVLNYAITQPNSATLVPTFMNLHTNALVDAKGQVISSPTAGQQNLSTLNYLFAVGGDALPAPAQLNWNWLDDNGSDVTTYNGAIAIKRDALASYFARQLTLYVNGNGTNVKGNCYVPQITTGPFLQNEYDLEMTQGTFKYSPFCQYQPYNIGQPDRLLEYIFNSHAHQPGWVDEKMPNNYLDIKYYFSLFLSVDASSQTLTLTQTLRLILDMVYYGEHGDQQVTGNPVDITYTDVFTPVVDAQGAINFTRNPNNSTMNDQSQTLAIPTDKIRSTNVGSWKDILKFASSFTQVPVAMPKQFVFPGGNAFTFKDAQFSRYSDLVCHVTYLAE